MATYLEELIVKKLRVDEVTIRESLTASGSATLSGLTVTGQALVNDLLLSDTVWEDMRYSSTLVRRGATNKPDFDYTNCGLLFPQNDAAEKIYISDQTPHKMVNDSTSVFKPHFHYIQTGATLPVFKLDYRIYQNGTAPPSFTTISCATEGVFTYTSGSMLQILPFAEIDMPDDFGVSTWFDFIFYRDDNVVSGDVLFKGLDCHYPAARLGSREVYSL